MDLLLRPADLLIAVQQGREPGTVMAAGLAGDESEGPEHQLARR